MTAPKVGIVIVHYRSFADTERCLNSLLEQAYSNWFAVVVDNSPDDPSGRQLVQAFDDPRLSFLIMPQNLGFAAGCNRGACQARELGADYLWFLNPDTEASRLALAGLIEQAEIIGHVKLGSLCSAVTYADSDPNVPPRIWGAGGTVDAARRRIAMHQDVKRGSQSASSPCAQAYEVDYSPGCSMLIPVGVWLAVGPFDESYFLYFEETDWCLRASRLGYPHYCAPESIVKHHTDDQKVQAAAVVYYYNRNSYFFWWRFLNWPGRLKLLWETLARKLPEARRALRAATRAEDREIFQAHCQAATDFLLLRRGAKPL